MLGPHPQLLSPPVVVLLGAADLSEADQALRGEPDLVRVIPQGRHARELFHCTADRVAALESQDQLCLFAHVMEYELDHARTASNNLSVRVHLLITLYSATAA